METRIRRIVVCLDGSSRGDRLGRQAAALARRLDAELVGLWGLQRPFPSPPERFARGPGAIREVLKHQTQQEQDLLSPARDAFEALARSFGLRAELHPAWDDDPDFAEFTTAADLIIVGHPRLPDLPEGLTADRLLLGCARPVLVVPAGWTGELGGRALIGWNGSRAARQAIDEALPLITADAPATILVVDGAAPLPATDELTQALQARGRRTSVKAVDSREGDVAEAIAEAADQLAADLIILGGYSRSPTVERWFGGVTRSLLATPPRPLLLSHVPDEVRQAAIDPARTEGGVASSFR